METANNYNYKIVRQFTIATIAWGEHTQSDLAATKPGSYSFGDPYSTTFSNRPLVKTSTRSAVRASARSCVTITIVCCFS